MSYHSSHIFSSCVAIFSRILPHIPVHVSTSAKSNATLVKVVYPPARMGGLFFFVPPFLTPRMERKAQAKLQKYGSYDVVTSPSPHLTILSPRPCAWSQSPLQYTSACPTPCSQLSFSLHPAKGAPSPPKPTEIPPSHYPAQRIRQEHPGTLR